MNAPLRSPVTAADDLADAREEAWRLFGAAAHYLRCAQSHLEIADDAGALWDVQHAREYFKTALKAFGPARAAMRQRVDNAGSDRLA